MQSNFPILGQFWVWFMCRNELYFMFYVDFFDYVTVNITPEVPPVIAISPSSKTFKDNALLGWSPLR